MVIDPQGVEAPSMRALWYLYADGLALLLAVEESLGVEHGAPRVLVDRGANLLPLTADDHIGV